MRNFLVFLAALTLFASIALAQHDGAGKAGKWDRLSDHPLNGLVWTGDGQVSSWDALINAALDHHFVLVGENHDNAAHHLVQAKLIGELVAKNRRPAVVFEMIPKGMQSQLDIYLSQQEAKASGLGDAIGWEKLGWPVWKTYQPIAEVTMEHDLAMVAGGLDRRLIMKLGKAGEKSLSDELRKALALDVFFPDDMRDSLLEELHIAHCELVPVEGLHPMVPVQRARDGVMANALLATGDGGGVLIAGKGHVRKDRGVPYVVSRIDPDASSLTIGLFGVEPEMVEFADYFPEEESKPLFDYILFTDRAEPIDHCASLREQFGGKTHYKPKD